jgi:outer membrane receptor protein involved in Fe transport
MGTVYAQTPAPAAANQSVGTIAGTIHDNSGAPIANAKVTLTGPATQSTTTDANGAFSFANVTPGVYTLTATKAGYQTANEPSLAVLAGQTQTLAVTMPQLTFQSLRTIATVRAAGRGTFNTTPASVSVVSSQTFVDQAQPQVMQVLNQTPGIVASYPQTSANGAVPGAITFPNIRGALSFETASLIDGHPVSVGSFGDYVTTFLNSFALGGVEVVKGPGADAPEVNYAIGGTVNFRTKDPTSKPTGNYTFGYGSYGSSLLNFSVSDTVGRLGYVVDYADNYNPGPLDNYQAWFAPGGHNTYINYNTGANNGTSVGFNDAQGQVPGTASGLFNNFQLVACCQAMNSTYESKAELVKLRYRLSNSTSATVAYLGSQTTADQNANTSSQLFGTFAPFSSYNGSLAPGAITITNLFPGQEQETNNEPIFEGDVRTTIGNDTLLARYYHASIYRLINQGGQNPWDPETDVLTLYGTNGGSASKPGPDVSGRQLVTFFNYFRQTEIDKLGGLSFQYNHPFGENNLLTFSVDGDSSTTTSFSASPAMPRSGPFTQSTIGTSYSVTVPTGAKQDFTTYLLRGSFQLNPKLNVTLSNYLNTYQSTYATDCNAPAAVAPNPKQCLPDGTGYKFATSTSSHYDPRLGIDFRPTRDLAVRFSVGSSIAPPYLALLNRVNGAVSYKTGNQFAFQTVNAGALRPETGFGYDLGADYRFNDAVTTLSGDVYLTNLYNHFISQTFFSGVTCTTAPCPASGVPLYFTTNTNLNNSRFEGIELSLRRTPPVGLGYVLQGALQKGYAYNLPPCFYSSNGDCTVFNTNLGIIAGQNFTGGALSPYTGTGSPFVGQSFNGFSNQNVPYAQGYAQLSYRFPSGLYAQVGETYLGKNNSLNVPPFGILNASIRAPIVNGLSLQVSGNNLTNAWSGLFPIQGGGIAIPLANGALGATTQNVLGPSTVRVMLIKNFGEGANPTP